MIKAESITRTYGKVVAVDDVSFQIEHGEIVGLLGHNGAGKTTIMKILTGFLEPSKGQASINDLEISSNRIKVQESIGYLPENCPVYPDMVVLDYLDYAATLHGVPDDKKAERIRNAVEKTRLREVAKQQISTLSRGYRQRLGVAQAILNSPAILILDEPTNGLDPSQIHEMRSLIRELAANATVLISTHILQEVQAVCGRVIIINRGKLALDASMKDLATSDRLTVCVDAETDKAKPVFESIEGLAVIDVKPKHEGSEYALECKGKNATELAPIIARKVVESGMQLFTLQPQVRDLETVFREITTKGRTANGASGEMKEPEVAGSGEAKEGGETNE